jgi:hypothetical protein
LVNMTDPEKEVSPTQGPMRMMDFEEEVNSGD